MVDSIEHHHKKEHFKQSTPLDIIEAEDYTTTTNDDHDNGSSRQQQHESSVFHNIESLVRNIDDNSDSDGNGGMSVHDKHSNEKNYSPPTPPPTPSPILISTTEEDTIYYSLRDYHSSNGNGDASSSTISHAKYSQEKNALNPNELPEEWIIAKTPPSLSPITISSPPPTEDIRRVNPYITNNNNNNVEGQVGEGEEYEHCRASKSTGVYYFDSSGSDNAIASSSSSRSDDNGIVLRYQYEIIQQHFTDNLSSIEGDLSERLTNDILPRLEVEISNILIPIFFHECLNNNGNNNDDGRGGDRASLRQRELITAKSARKRRERRRRRRRRLLNNNNAVIGIDALPRDFPLSQQGTFRYVFVISLCNIYLMCKVLFLILPFG